ncbi:MAG TPA: hypothetical protein VKV28_08990 [Candidatus Binataceae bacterium]|nr:hypothetical protein [Candidatus Binataceae bacterium]
MKRCLLVIAAFAVLVVVERFTPPGMTLSSTRGAFYQVLGIDLAWLLLGLGFVGFFDRYQAALCSFFTSIVVLSYIVWRLKETEHLLGYVAFSFPALTTICLVLSGVVCLPRQRWRQSRTEQCQRGKW